MDDATPDYASCSLRDLYDVERRIDRKKYPERYALLCAEIERREASGAVEKMKRQESRVGHILKVRCFSTLFFVAGVIAFFAGVASPFLFTLRSREWQKVPCVIVHTSPDNPSLRPIYQYRFRGVQYVGKKLSSSAPLRSNPSSWRRAYPNGTRAFCFVNPSDPKESVLTWGLGFGFFLLLAWSAFAVVISVHAFRNPLDMAINGRKPN